MAGIGGSFDAIIGETPTHWTFQLQAPVGAAQVSAFSCLAKKDDSTVEAFAAMCGAGLAGFVAERIKSASATVVDV